MPLTENQLTTELRAALALLPQPADWVLPSGADTDVAVIGAGQSGLAIAFALARAGIRRVRLFDAEALG